MTRIGCHTSRVRQPRHTFPRRAARSLLAAAALVLTSSSALSAQAGCIYTKAIWCDGKGVCTINEGSDCVTCKQDE